MLTGLARKGRADADRIAEELERDNTISGQEHAAAALASRPTAEAKAEAEIAMVRDDVANETQRSVVLAFQCFGQDEVLAPYVDSYLAAADTLWEDKGTQRASTALESCPQAARQPGAARPGRRVAGDLAGEPRGQALRARGTGRRRAALAAQEKDAQG